MIGLRHLVVRPPGVHTAYGELSTTAFACGVAHLLQLNQVMIACSIRALAGLPEAQRMGSSCMATALSAGAGSRVTVECQAGDCHHRGKRRVRRRTCALSRLSTDGHGGLTSKKMQPIRKRQGLPGSANSGSSTAVTATASEDEVCATRAYQNVLLHLSFWLQ